MRDATIPFCEALETRLLLDGFSGPDLIPVTNDTVIPSTVVPGESGVVRVNITNQGDQPAVSKTAASKYTLGLFLSLDDTFDQNTDVLIGQYSSTVNLAAKAGVTVNVSVAIPLDIAPGNYRLFTFLDTTDVLTVNESDVLNNIVEARNSGGDPRVRAVVWKFGIFDGRTNVALMLPGNNGKAVLFKLTGPGMGVVTSSATSPDGKVSYDVTVTNSTTASVMTITTGAGSGVVLGNVDVQASIKSVLAGGLPLVGDLTIDGSCTTLTLGDVGAALANDVTISIGAGGALAATFGQIGNLQFISAGPVKSFVASNWLDSFGSPESIDQGLAGDAADTFTAPSLASMTIGKKGVVGDFQADLVITGDPAKANLGTVSITGSLAGDWTISGSLKSLTVARDVTDSTIRTTGSMTSVTVGACHGSTFLAGMANTVGHAPASAADFVAAATIGTFAVKGYAAGGASPRFFVDTNLCASRFGKVTLMNLDTQNGGTPFGLFVKDIPNVIEIGQVSGTDTYSGLSWTWKPKNENPLNAFPDFAVSILS